MKKTIYKSSKISPEIEALVALEKKVTILEREVAELKARFVPNCPNCPNQTFVPLPQGWIFYPTNNWHALTA